MSMNIYVIVEEQSFQQIHHRCVDMLPTSTLAGVEITRREYIKRPISFFLDDRSRFPRTNTYRKVECRSRSSSLPSTRRAYLVTRQNSGDINTDRTKSYKKYIHYVLFSNGEWMYYSRVSFNFLHSSAFSTSPSGYYFLFCLDVTMQRSVFAGSVTV